MCWPYPLLWPPYSKNTQYSKQKCLWIPLQHWNFFVLRLKARIKYWKVVSLELNLGWVYFRISFVRNIRIQSTPLSSSASSWETEASPGCSRVCLLTQWTPPLSLCGSEASGWPELKSQQPGPWTALWGSEREHQRESNSFKVPSPISYWHWHLQPRPCPHRLIPWYKAPSSLSCVVL